MDAEQNRPTTPARARRLLDEASAGCVAGLRTPLQQCLDTFAHELLTRADQANQAGAQQDLFAARQRLQHDRANLAQRFASQLATAFARAGQRAPAPAAPANGWRQLELLDPVEHELNMALEQRAARVESRHGPVLNALGYRLGVLVAAPPLEGRALPPGPHALIHTFHLASQPLDLPLPLQLLLLQCFDQCVLKTLGPLLEALDAHLTKAGILPHLHAMPLPRHVASRPHVVADPPRPAPAPAPAANEPIAVLESLRDLLARQREGAPTGSPSARVASDAELQTALEALQQHLVDVTDRASRELRSAQRLREELLAHLNHGKAPDAPRTELSSEQGDTVELVAMLFEQLARQLQRSDDAQALLGGLELPLLRMAMVDHDFFEQREHPARQLLDTLAATANDWLDDNDSEGNRALIAKLEQLVARARHEPPSAGLYTSLLADIRHHVELLNRKAQATEHRHMEAAQGRERLDNARQRATELMAERFARSAPRGLLRALLDRAWSDVLALTLLRHGEDSDAFTAQLRVTDQLLGHVPAPDRQQLRQEVETGLRQIGMHAEEATQVALRLLGGETAQPTAELPSATDLAVRLKQHQRLGEQASRAATPTPAPAPAASAVDPRERDIERRLRQLPFGSWFEFDDAATGGVVRRKLSWYSPMSGHCLLVTRRGQRGEETTLAQLARAIALGHAREAPPRHDSLLDRAWAGLTGALRQPRQPRASAQGNRRP